MTVKLVDVSVPPGTFGPVTTAHVAIARFYCEHLAPPRRRSYVDQVRHANSSFDVWVITKDFANFAAPNASAKVREAFARAAEVRLAELKGWLP